MFKIEFNTLFQGSNGFDWLTIIPTLISLGALFISYRTMRNQVKNISLQSEKVLKTGWINDLRTNVATLTGTLYSAIVAKKYDHDSIVPQVSKVRLFLDVYDEDQRHIDDALEQIISLVKKFNSLGFSTKTIDEELLRLTDGVMYRTKIVIEKESYKMLDKTPPFKGFIYPNRFRK